MLLTPKLAVRVLASVLAVGSLLAHAGPPGAPKPPPGMRMEAIHDPGLNLDAYYVAIPVDWHFQGAAIYGNGCGPQPFPVFRASSPDGLTVLERLPRFGWSWGTLGWHPKQPRKGCLPLTREMTASEFLKHLAEMLQVEYVAEVPVPAEVVAAKKRDVDAFNALGAEYARTHPANVLSKHGEVADAKVRYQNGTFPMEGLLRVTLVCTRSNVVVQGQPFWSDTCGATVRTIRAPKGKLDDAVAKLKFAGATPNLQWGAAYTEMQGRAVQAGILQGEQILAQMKTQNDQSQALLQSQHEQFMQSQALQQRQHEEFLSTLQRGTNMSMQRAAQSSSAQQTAASDMVDYALGQQTVRDPTSGQLYKASASRSYVWVDDSGKKSYQTSDPNANPNGSLQGTWTLQQKVHGDGTSK